MKRLDEPLPGLQVLQAPRFADARGWYEELSRREWDDLLNLGPMLQESVALSEANVVRGLHFQRPPHAQSKLVTVLSGEVLDVVVDLRKGSPGFGQSFALRLSAAQPLLLFIPAGFAHGYAVLQPPAVFFYRIGLSVYAPQAEGGLLWNDPDLNIDWPVTADRAVLSEKDRHWPRLRDFDSPFVYT